MAELRYSAEIVGAPPVTGAAELAGGKLELVLPLPEGVLGRVAAELRIDMAADEKLFMNGYQTWTYCPEYGRDGYTEGMRRLPGFIIKRFGIDRYGDYFFTDYPKKPGMTQGESYCYFRRGDKFRLIASLDERPGYTLLRYDSASGVLSLTRDCAGVRCAGGFHAFDLFYAEGGEDEVFDAWFAAMGVECRTREKLAGYSSWYNRYQNIDERSIRNDLDGCAGQLSPGDLFQIDDGWESAVGDWLAADGKKFPGGMGAAAEEIHARGYRAGLWLAPFVCQMSSRVFREHGDWLLRVGGEPWYCGSNWGGFYSLDIDNVQVTDYLKRCFERVLGDWSYDLVKLDFLYAAAPFGTACESRAGRMARAMELLRRFCGDKLILGCGVPLFPAFGVADYCRISCDVGLDWDNSLIMRHTNRERVSTRQAVGNTVFRRELNGRAFLSDPDVFFLRDDNIKLSPAQKYALATVNSLFGGVLLHSDDMSRYSDDARALYRQLLRNREAKNIRVDAEDGLSVSYELDGVEQLVRIE